MRTALCTPSWFAKFVRHFSGTVRDSAPNRGFPLREASGLEVS
jgi:hypothetical protein